MAPTELYALTVHQSLTCPAVASRVGGSLSFALCAFPFSRFLLFSALLIVKISGKLPGVSTVKEIQAAIPKLSREEIEEIREWIDDYLEDQLELTSEVKAKLDQSRREIAAYIPLRKCMFSTDFYRLASRSRLTNSLTHT